MVITDLSVREPKAQARAKILCVDDQPANLFALQSVLGREDYVIVEASSGEEAVELVQKDDFAVILLDVQMPGMDGLQAAKNIRANPRSQSTPIIFLTAIYSSESYALQGYEAGAVDYLYKPLDPGILRAKVAAFVALHRAKVDIGELRKVEQALREALQIRDEFLSIASHELKTPITPLQLQLQGFLRMIEAGKFNSTPIEQMKSMLEISDAQVSRLSRLIEQLLDISRIDEGRLALQFERFNLSEMVQSTLDQLRYQLEAAECKLELNLEPNLTGIWDRLRLEQVLTNLLTNSMKYAAGGLIEITASMKANMAAFSVKDNGMGIAREDQVRIFDRFERAVPLKNFGGLGLYVSREIVRLHKGKISVESEPGKGAAFVVDLPLMPEPNLLN